MYPVEQILSGIPADPLIVGAVAGAVVTVVLHIIRRIRRLIRTAAFLAIASCLGASGSSQILHTILTNWR